VKLFPLAILAMLLTGCAALHKQPISVGDVPSARLGDVKSEASSIAEELNTSTTAVSADADSLDKLVDEGRALVPQIADYWQRLSTAVAKTREGLAKAQALVGRQQALVVKIQSVQAQVDAQSKTIIDLRAQLAKAQSVTNARQQGFYFLVIAGCIVGIIVGVFLIKVDMPKWGMASIAASATGLGIALVLSQSQWVQPIVAGGVLLVVVVALGFAAYKKEKDAAQKNKAIVQIVKSNEVAAPVTQQQSALRALAMSSVQDPETEQIVRDVKASLSATEIKSGQQKVIAASRATPIIPPSPLPPAALQGLVGAEATVAAGDATVRGPVVPSQ
jgi:hypothetical protein